MSKLTFLIRFSGSKEKGASFVEYAFLASLIAIISVAMLTGIGQEVNKPFSVVNSAFVSASG